MSFSYRGVIGSGSGVVTLPSVDSWGANFSVLRDPPKSIMTRKIDKVGDDMSLINTQEDSSDRSCEAILHYARGQNPFVSVSYQNSDGTSAKLPHTLSDVFRPPILRQEQLLPLSRLPRNVTSCNTTPEIIDFTKKIMCQKPVENTRECRNTILKTSCKPTAVYKVTALAEKPFEVKYVIQNPVKSSANAGVRSMDIKQRENKKPLKEIDEHNLHVYPQTNVSNEKRYVNKNGKFNANKFLQVPLNTNANTNVSEDKYVNVNGKFNSNKYLQDPLNTNALTNTSYNKYVNNNGEFNSSKYVQDNLNAFAVTNTSEDKYVNNNGEFNSSKYVQDALNPSAITNTSLNIQVTPINELFDLSEIQTTTKNVIHSDYTTNKQGSNKQNYISTTMNLDRNLPEYEALTNKNDSRKYTRIDYENELELMNKIPLTEVTTNMNSNQININDDLNSKEFTRLRQKVSAGGFSGNSSIPQVVRNDTLKNLQPKKLNVTNRMSQQMRSSYY